MKEYKKISNIMKKGSTLAGPWSQGSVMDAL
jgi:hypothetical protein